MPTVKKYDVIVIGKGASGYVMNEAAEKGLKVAVVDRPPIGGTCMNVGCVPSKTLLYSADRVRLMKNSSDLGLKIEKISTNFTELMKQVRSNREQSRKMHRKQIEKYPNIDFYESEGRFLDCKTVLADNQKIHAEKIFIANGARPFIPNIPGLDKLDYLTNESILELKEKPKDVLILGGGYIALEYAHFLSAYGVNVTIIEKNSGLMEQMEPEISNLLEEEVKKYATLHLNAQVINFDKIRGRVDVQVKLKEGDIQIEVDKVFVATGRKSNADTLSLENTEISTDQHGYIKVDEFLETSQADTWAFGDVIGKYMLKHVANEEARIVWNNAMRQEKQKMKYHAAPLAVYCYPEIASVGLTVKNAAKSHDLLIGQSDYSGVFKGQIMKDSQGFVKAVVEKKSRKLLGFHIFGPHASILIQEAVNVIANQKTIDFIINSMHAFPSLSEIMLKPLLNLKSNETKKNRR